MDEPTLAELLRAVRADVQRLVDTQSLYVTKEILDLKLDALTKDQAEDRARLDKMSNIVWSAVIGPVIVGVVLYFLLGGKP